MWGYNSNHVFLFTRKPLRQSLEMLIFIFRGFCVFQGDQLLKCCPGFQAQGHGKSCQGCCILENFLFSSFPYRIHSSSCFSDSSFCNTYKTMEYLVLVSLLCSLYGLFLPGKLKFGKPGRSMRATLSGKIVSF